MRFMPLPRLKCPFWSPPSSLSTALAPTWLQKFFSSFVRTCMYWFYQVIKNETNQHAEDMKFHSARRHFFSVVLPPPSQLSHWCFWMSLNWASSRENSVVEGPPPELRPPLWSPWGFGYVPTMSEFGEGVTVVLQAYFLGELAWFQVEVFQ